VRVRNPSTLLAALGALIVAASSAVAQGGAASPAPRAELTVWTTRALATVLGEVGAQFERATGLRLVVVSDLPTGFARRAESGESFDLLISGSAPVDEWIRQGRIVAESRTAIARSAIGVAVHAGAPRPDIGSVEAFRRALLAARSIAFLRVGSGIHMTSVIERLGIADAVRPKLTRPETDVVAELVAKGEIELGIVVVTQILTTPGVDLVGALPPELQSWIVFTAGVGAQSRAPDAARELIRFLRGPTAIPVIRAQGMEPVR
jgi:molybdate transport system substrate-binding protein